jgi:hypothetical protein
VAELIICSVDTQKVGNIRCHRQNIGILTSDLESTLKTGPGYSMSYSDMVSVVPFWVIIIVIALAWAVEQIC